MRQRHLTYLLVFLTVLAVVQFANAEKARLTSNAEMMSRLVSLETHDLISGTGRVHVVSIGQSVKGKPIPLVTISDPNVDQSAVKKLFVICRQHGNEPASTEAMLSLIDKLALGTDEETSALLKKVAFYIVPMVNPDGAGRFERRNANGADINRDWITLWQPETRCVRAAIDAVAPDVLIDEHELSPGNNKTDFIETAGITSGAQHDIVAESAQLEYLVIGMLRTQDMSVRSCRIEDHSPARLAHRYFPIFGKTKTLLFETKQAGTRQYKLAERMKLHIVGTMTVAKYLAGQDVELRQLIANHDQWRRSVQLASRKAKRSTLIRNIK